MLPQAKTGRKWTSSWRRSWCWRSGCGMSLGCRERRGNCSSRPRPTCRASSFARSSGHRRAGLLDYRRRSAGVRPGARQHRPRNKGRTISPRLVAVCQRAHARIDRPTMERPMPDPRHEPETLLANVLHEVKSATTRIDERDSATRSRLNSLENSINDLMKRAGRPSGGNGRDTDERAQAIEMLEQKFFATQTKRDVSLPAPSFSEEQIAESKLAIRGIRLLMHSTSIDQVPLDQRKALSACSFGAQCFILAPEMSSQILSCLIAVGDITGLMQNIDISGSSVKFLVDNELWDVAAWACDSSCFAN